MDKGKQPFRHIREWQKARLAEKFGENWTEVLGCQSPQYAFRKYVLGMSHHTHDLYAEEYAALQAIAAQRGISIGRAIGFAALSAIGALEDPNKYLGKLRPKKP